MTTPNVGHVPTVEELNLGIAGDAVALNDAVIRIEKRWSYVVGVGQAGFEGPPWNMSPEDAQTFFEAANHMQTVTAIYRGMQAQPDPFDFEGSLAGVRGGQ
jgi:hypothetical protein